MPMDIVLFAVLALLLVFMFWNSRKRMQKMKAEQEAKRQQTVPGAKVLLQGGLYGTIISYDADDLDAPAQVELAPGVVVEVHSQSVLRIVDPVEGEVTSEEFLEAEDEAALAAFDDVPEIEKIPAETEANDADKDKPQA